MGNQQTAVKDQPYALAIASARDRFLKTNGANLDYQAEALFALQACQNGNYLAKVANDNPFSVSMAVANVAAIGLTLNPALGLAFLVPRHGKVILDISYRGLIKLATDSGSIKWAKSELVYVKDRFEYRGVAREPLHVADVFSQDRGEFIGVYCIAKTCDGDFLVEAVKAEEIFKIRDKSSAYTKDKSGPWVDWFEEMVKKSAVKRASKTWPKTDQRLQEAIRLLNVENGEGLDFDSVSGGSGSGPATVVLEPKGSVPKEKEVAKKVVNLVKTVIDRSAKVGGAWVAAKAYVGEKLTGSDLDYALDAITRAERAQPPPADAGGA